MQKIRNHNTFGPLNTNSEKCNTVEECFQYSEEKPFPNLNYTHSRTISQIWEYSKVVWLPALYPFLERATQNREFQKRRHQGLKYKIQTQEVGGEKFQEASCTLGAEDPLFRLRLVRRFSERLLWEDTLSRVPDAFEYTGN